MKKRRRITSDVILAYIRGKLPLIDRAALISWVSLGAGALTVTVAITGVDIKVGTNANVVGVMVGASANVVGVTIAGGGVVGGGAGGGAAIVVGIGVAGIGGSFTGTGAVTSG